MIEAINDHIQLTYYVFKLLSQGITPKRTQPYFSQWKKKFYDQTLFKKPVDIFENYKIVLYPIYAHQGTDVRLHLQKFYFYSPTLIILSLFFGV